MHNYKNLNVWNKSIDLTLMIYEITKNYPKIESYGLKSQMRRAVVSISSNIAEGAGRNSDNEFKQFLHYAYGSTTELDTQVIISEKLNYLTNDLAQEICEHIDEIQKMIFSLIKRFS